MKLEYEHLNFITTILEAVISHTLTNMIKPGDIISYSQMCLQEGYSLQRGMNYQVGGGTSVILMSLRKGAPYADRIENNGEVLIYEGHDLPRNEASNPKAVDQSLLTPTGLLTQNGKFFNAAERYKSGLPAELVNVYEKIKDGIWVYNGLFELIDAWGETSETENRKVFKFKLKITDKTIGQKVRSLEGQELEHNRMIPASIKLQVWKRDKGKCVQCGSSNNLHFDHILPFAKGGTSLKAENIQLLCARHNLQKSDRIL